MRAAHLHRPTRLSFNDFSIVSRPPVTGLPHGMQFIAVDARNGGSGDRAGGAKVPTDLPRFRRHLQPSVHETGGGQSIGGIRQTKVAEPEVVHQTHHGAGANLHVVSERTVSSGGTGRRCATGRYSTVALKPSRSVCCVGGFSIEDRFGLTMGRDWIPSLRRRSRLPSVLRSTILCFRHLVLPNCRTERGSIAGGKALLVTR